MYQEREIKSNNEAGKGPYLINALRRLQTINTANEFYLMSLNVLHFNTFSLSQVRSFIVLILTIHLCLDVMIAADEVI